MEQYRTFDNIKALYILTLQSLLRNFDILLRALICREAREQMTEMWF